MSTELRFAVEWWIHVLRSQLTEEITWHSRAPRVVDMFCDARGWPASLAAVVIENGQLQYTAWDVPIAVVSAFSDRRDSQIMGLELLAIVVGMTTFRQQLRGVALRVWTDNVGGEGALKKGSAFSTDHNYLVHAVWLLAALDGISLWFERVPSKQNIADAPSRNEFSEMHRLKAGWRRPVLPEQLWRPGTWMHIAA